MPKQRVYLVEKFIPRMCPQPRCFNEFQHNRPGENGYLIEAFWMHESPDATQKVLNSTNQQGLATDLITCCKCGKTTIRILIESRLYAQREQAEAALIDGFVNLRPTFSHSKQRFEGMQVTRHFVPNLDKAGRVQFIKKVK